MVCPCHLSQALARLYPEHPALIALAQGVERSGPTDRPDLDVHAAIEQEWLGPLMDTPDRQRLARDHARLLFGGADAAFFEAHAAWEADLFPRLQRRKPWAADDHDDPRRCETCRMYAWGGSAATRLEDGYVVWHGWHHPACPVLRRARVGPLYEGSAAAV